MLLATFAITLSLGIETGIGAGVVLSLGMVVYRSTRPHVALLGRVPGSPFYRNVQRFNNLEQRPDVLVVRFDGPLYFANVNYFKDKMGELIAQKDEALRLIVLNSDSISYLDSSAIHALEEWVLDNRSRGVQVFFTSVIGPVRDTLNRWELTETIGEKHFFMSNQQAIDTFDGMTTNGVVKDYREYILQAN
jgi:SulP family sulfate permease